jgi:hypothetical protein
MKCVRKGSPISSASPLERRGVAVGQQAGWRSAFGPLGEALAAGVERSSIPAMLR